MTEQQEETDGGRRFGGPRVALGAAFLAAYAAASLVPGPLTDAVLLGTGGLLYLMSVPRASAFHKVLAAVAALALGALVLSGGFDPGAFLSGMQTYFGIVAVLLVLSIAGYPIRAERFAGSIRGLVSAAARRGVGARASSGALGHFLGAVLDVGSFVLIDVILRRAAPKERVEALAWAGRGFSFCPLWTNLNVLTVTAISLTGVSYPGLLAVSLPFVVVGLACTLFLARDEQVEEPPEEEAQPEMPLDRDAAAVLLYPVLLVAAVGFASVLLAPGLSLTAIISATVAIVVVFIAVLASTVLRRSSPMLRLGRETRDALVESHAEFALFVSAGILVISLEELGALAPVGEVFSALPSPLVAPALALVTAVGFVAGIHVVPFILLVDTAFPLSGAPSPLLAAVAVLLGSQVALLLTPFSNSVTMLARLTGLHPFEIGPKKNWKFSLTIALAAAVYLTLLTFLLL